MNHKCHKCSSAAVSCNTPRRGNVSETWMQPVFQHPSDLVRQRQCAEWQKLQVYTWVWINTY